jgi:hypothetical protein
MAPRPVAAVAAGAGRAGLAAGAARRAGGPAIERSTAEPGPAARGVTPGLRISARTPAACAAVCTVTTVPAAPPRAVRPGRQGPAGRARPPDLRPRPIRRDTGSRGIVARDAGQPARELRGCQIPGWQRSQGLVPDYRTRRVSVTDFYGIQAGTIPGFRTLAAGSSWACRACRTAPCSNGHVHGHAARHARARPAGVRGVRTARRLRDRGPAPQGEPC